MLLLVVIIKTDTRHVPLLNGSEPQAMSIFDTAALSRQSFMLYDFEIPLLKPQEIYFDALYMALAKNFKLLQKDSNILKHWIVRYVKNKFTLWRFGVSSFQKTIPRFPSCFEYLHPYNPFIIALSISHFSKLLNRSSRDQIFLYQSKYCCISKAFFRVLFSYSGIGDEMLNQ